MTQPFDRVKVDYVVQGGARIWFDLNRHFIDPGSYTFQLQVGHTALEAADDWIDVGSPVVNTYMIFDPTKRIFGKTPDIHYRVQLTTGVGSYTSMTAGTEGLLSERDWLIYRELTRKEVLRHQKQTSVNGFLLKARRYGPKCTECSDALTEEVSQTNCAVCYGTGFEFGYFTPLAATFADLSLPNTREHRDANIGMEKKDVITGRFIGDPQLYSYDVWCNGYSDERYYIHTITEKAHVRGVPVIYEVELRLAPFSDVVYTFPISQLPLQARKEEKKWQSKKPSLNYLEDAFAVLKAAQNRSSRR